MVSQTEVEHNSLSLNQTIRVQIGEICCAIRCRDTELRGRLQQLYNNFLSDKPSDITIELEVVDHLSPAEVEAALADTRYIHKGNHFRTTSQVIAGEYDLASRIISITAERSLYDPGSEFNHLNRLISLAYYSACKVKYDRNPPAMLVHACGIVRHGRAIVFAGPSDTGKTSIAQLCGKRHGEVINDEMLLISRPTPGGNGVSAQGAPVVGGLSSRRNISAPLRCILLLKRGGKTLARYLEKSEAYLQFMRQIVTPAHIGQRSGRAVYSLMADFSAELTRTTPVYELEFTLDGESLWQAVGEIEKSLGKMNEGNRNASGQD